MCIFIFCFQGIRIISEKLAQTNMMKRLGAEPLGRVHPRCTEHTYDSSAYWECFIRQSAFPLSHLVGTCKMGSDKDPTAVVGPDLRYVLTIQMKQFFYHF